MIVTLIVGIAAALLLALGVYFMTTGASFGMGVFLGGVVVLCAAFVVAYFEGNT